MKKMRVAFYKANEGGYDDKFIDKFSGNLGYSHCEIVASNTEGISAHMQTGGVSSFIYPDLLNSKYWDVYELDIHYSANAIKTAKDMIGTKYDYLGVATSFIGIDLPNDSKVWCSEFVLEIVNVAIREKGINPLKTRLMPNQAYTLLQKELNAKLISNSTSLQATYNSKAKKTDRWGRLIKDTTPKENWFWRMFG